MSLRRRHPLTPPPQAENLRPTSLTTLAVTSVVLPLTVVNEQLTVASSANAATRPGKASAWLSSAEVPARHEKDVLEVPPSCEPFWQYSLVTDFLGACAAVYLSSPVGESGGRSVSQPRAGHRGTKKGRECGGRHTRCTRRSRSCRWSTGRAAASQSKQGVSGSHWEGQEPDKGRGAGRWAGGRTSMRRRSSVAATSEAERPTAARRSDLRATMLDLEKSVWLGCECEYET